MSVIFLAWSSFTVYFFVFLNSRYRTASGHHDCSSTVRWYNNTTTTHFFKLALDSFKKDEAQMLERWHRFMLSGGF